MISKLEKFLSQIYDLLFPKDVETILIENMSEYDILNTIPPANEIKNTKYKALFQYKNKLSRKAIWAIKYNKNQKIINKFSNLLYEFIMEDISEKVNFIGFNNPLLIPIPMHKNNLKERGYNQSELIVKEVYKIDQGKNFDILINTLLKIKETPHQSSLKNKDDRLKNLKNCFYIESGKIKDRNIILIDDVITTGTTMNEVSKILKSGGARKIIGYSIAH